MEGYIVNEFIAQREGTVFCRHWGKETLAPGIITGPCCILGRAAMLGSYLYVHRTVHVSCPALPELSAHCPDVEG
jgi:hypothetical protein